MNTTPTKAVTIGQFLRVPGLNADLAGRTFHRHIDYRHKITFNTSKGAVHFDKKDQVLFDASHPKPPKKRGPKPTGGVGKWKNTFWLSPDSKRCLESELAAQTQPTYGEIIDMALKMAFPQYYQQPTVAQEATP